MLTKCPECDLQVSDKALTCPHCGYPINTQSQTKYNVRNKRMKLPNGFGSINLEKRNLRNPYRAMVTVGHTPEGKPIRKVLKPKGYFKTYNEAYEALVEYHKNPYDLEPDMTIQQLYDRWSDYYFETLNSQSSVRTIIAAWRYCSSVYNMRAKDVRARHIKGCMDDGKIIKNGVTVNPSPAIKSRIKSLFNLMFDYALEYELVDKNYARTFEISSKLKEEAELVKRCHIPFTDEEMQLLWDNVDSLPYADIMLIQCYTGFRPQELGLLKIQNINLDNDTIIGGMKTKSGTNRLVPIHPCIRPFIKAHFDEAVKHNRENLFNCDDGITHTSNRKLTYDKYAYRFSKVVEYLKLNPDHRPHDPRKHFVTMAKRYDVNEYAIKYIVGHSISDITESVYTQRNTEWLANEMRKIK